MTFEHLLPPKNALVRLTTPPGVISHDGAHLAPTITQLLIILKISAIRVDRRPSSYPIPFHDAYLVELQQNIEESASEQRSIENSWILEVKAGLERIKDIGGDAVLLGIW